MLVLANLVRHLKFTSPVGEKGPVLNSELNGIVQAPRDGMRLIVEDRPAKLVEE